MNSIICIDGLSATGKTTIGRELAKRLNYNHVSSGNIYRAITHILLTNHISLTDINILQSTLLSYSFKFVNTIGVFVNEKYLEKELRESIVEENVKEVVQIPVVRATVNDLIKKEVLNTNTVIDGRDIGTILFPKANAKFFFVRDLKQKGLSEKLESGILNELDFQYLDKRDIEDIKRTIAPLRKAVDAITIYSYEQDLDNLIIKITDIAKKHLN